MSQNEHDRRIGRWPAEWRFRGGEAARPGGPLVVIYATDLEAVASSIRAAGGTITQPRFDFPGGRRFHLRDPCGHELAAWSDLIARG